MMEMVKTEFHINNISVYNADCILFMKSIPDESVDIICIDPPYLYLKNQKLDRAFNEEVFFTECYRILSKSGFIVMFGRGTSFYRWNTMLADLGMKFKEEIIWDKVMNTSPLMNISRIHESISIHTKKDGVINKTKIPYLEAKNHNIDAIVTDIKRLKTVLKNTKSLDAVLKFLELNKVDFNPATYGHRASDNGDHGTIDRSLAVLKGIKDGMNEKTIIKGFNCKLKVSQNPNCRNGLLDRDRCEKVIQSVSYGLNEKSIIEQVRDHRSSIHPTQKPVRLLERLLALVIPGDKTPGETIVCDFFGGSFSTMDACNNMGLRGISTEIDEEYFNAGIQRLKDCASQQMFDFSEASCQ